MRNVWCHRRPQFDFSGTGPQSYYSIDISGEGKVSSFHRKQVSRNTLTAEEEQDESRQEGVNTTTLHCSGREDNQTQVEPTRAGSLRWKTQQGAGMRRISGNHHGNAQ